jgi:hypothetical protein
MNPTVEIRDDLIEEAKRVTGLSEAEAVLNRRSGEPGAVGRGQCAVAQSPASIDQRAAEEDAVIGDRRSPPDAS